MGEPQERHIDGDRLWREMVWSVNKFLAAEADFADLKSAYLNEPVPRHVGPDDKSRQTRFSADPRTKEAISNAAYFRDRASMFAAAYQAAVTHDGIEYAIRRQQNRH